MGLLKKPEFGGDRIGVFVVFRGVFVGFLVVFWVGGYFCCVFIKILLALSGNCSILQLGSLENRV